MVDLLGDLNEGSDWTDGPFNNGIWPVSGNQSDDAAHMHAMRSEGQTPAAAEVKWKAYLDDLVKKAKDLSDNARSQYAEGKFQLAMTLEVNAVKVLGELFHTFDDSFAPSHSGFQHWTLRSSGAHHKRETMAVYETGYYKSEVFHSGGYREYIYESIFASYSDVVNYVLRQPE